MNAATAPFEPTNTSSHDLPSDPESQRMAVVAIRALVGHCSEAELILRHSADCVDAGHHRALLATLAEEFHQFAGELLAWGRPYLDHAPVQAPWLMRCHREALMWMHDLVHPADADLLRTAQRPIGRSLLVYQHVVSLRVLGPGIADLMLRHIAHHRDMRRHLLWVTRQARIRSMQPPLS